MGGLTQEDALGPSERALRPIRTGWRRLRGSGHFEMEKKAAGLPAEPGQIPPSAAKEKTFDGALAFHDNADTVAVNLKRE